MYRVLSFLLIVAMCCAEKKVPNTCSGFCACEEDKLTTTRNSTGAFDYLEYHLGACEDHMNKIRECRRERCPGNGNNVMLHTIIIIH